MKSTMEFLLIFLLMFFAEQMLFGQSYATVPFTDNFSGTGTALSSPWSTYFTNATKGRIERRNMLGNWPLIGTPTTDGNTLGSAYSSAYGEPEDEGLFIYNVNGSAPANYLSANLALNLENATEVESKFQIQDWGTGGAPGTNHYDVLNVYISNNGGGSFGTTSTLVDLGQLPYEDGKWNTVSVDISALAAANSLALTANTIVRFTYKLTKRGSLTDPHNSSYAYIYMDNFEVNGTTTPLPIELISFSAVKNNQQASLFWQTASEINNDYFMVQRSTDGIHFEDLMEVSGQGNSTSVNNYFVYDENPFNGINYYRLKQIDYDETSAYSKVVSLDFSEDKFLLFPNPSSGFINIAHTINNNTQIMVYDAIGKLVFYQDLKTNNAPNNISLEHLENGNYFIQMINDSNNMHAQKITLIH